MPEQKPLKIIKILLSLLTPLNYELLYPPLHWNHAH